jgi:hypothetical protein
MVCFCPNDEVGCEVPLGKDLIGKSFTRRSIYRVLNINSMDQRPNELDWES